MTGGYNCTDITSLILDSVYKWLEDCYRLMTDSLVSARMILATKTAVSDTKTDLDVMKIVSQKTVRPTAGLLSNSLLVKFSARVLTFD